MDFPEESMKGLFTAGRRPLRYFTVWRMIGWLLVALIVYGSLMHSPPQVIRVPQGDKIEHMFAYAVLMGWFLQLYTRAVHLRLAAACIALGIGMEYAQLASGYRDFEYLDMVADGAGVCVAWLLGATVLGQVLSRFERWMSRRG